MRFLPLSRSAATLAFAASFGAALGQTHPAAPDLSSRAGAPYTLYLNFTGFNYTGTWDGKTPGNVDAFNASGSDPNTFDAGEIATIRNAWAYVAQKFTPFNINVTTVDPAIAAGRASSDLDRQTYYGEAPRLMQTIIGGSNAWYSSGAGGVSEVGTTQYPNQGQWHTNWVFPNNLGRSAKNIGEASAHEQGHGLNLWHQKDEVSGAEYSRNGGASGSGSYAPVMGVAYSSQRGAWRSGTGNLGPQNDVATLLTNLDIGDLVNDGLGHDLASATAMPLVGGAVDFTRASGIIVPKNRAAAGPLGVDNYLNDYFAFASTGGAVTLTVNEGSQFLTPGVADPGATSDSTLDILDLGGKVVASGVADATTLRKTFAGTLPAGSYVARIASRGGYSSTYEPNAPYFTMGSYFLTGSGIAPVPEPATLAALGLGVAAMLRRRRRTGRRN